MQVEDYQKLGALLKQVSSIMLTHQRPKGKTKQINRDFNKANKNFNALKDSLDRMFYVEHKEQYNDDLFSGY